MRIKIDENVAMDFAAALSTMICFRRPPDIAPNPRPAMFLVGPACDDQGFEQLSRDQGMDLIRLGFEPGREQAGPTNISVYEERNGVLNVWKDCSPWAQSAQGPIVVLANDRSVGFAYDGEAITMIWGGPSPQGFDEGAKLGRAMLRAMVRCIPEDRVTRRERRAEREAARRSGRRGMKTTARDEGRPAKPTREDVELGSGRKPLPKDLNIHVYGAGDLVMEIHGQLGNPLRDLIDLDLQMLHDIVRANTAPEDSQSLDHLVVVGDETGEMLKMLLRRTIERLRPENRGVAHNLGVTSRSIATACR